MSIVISGTMEWEERGILSIENRRPGEISDQAYISTWLVPIDIISKVEVNELGCEAKVADQRLQTHLHCITDSHSGSRIKISTNSSRVKVVWPNP